jgi:hypothetical protein
VGTLIRRPIRISGVGHCPVLTKWYANVRPIPSIEAAVGTSTTAAAAGRSVPVIVAPFISVLGGLLGSTLHVVVNFLSHERCKIVERFHIRHGVGP